MYYLQLVKVLNPDGASGRLAKLLQGLAVVPLQVANHLKRFFHMFFPP